MKDATDALLERLQIHYEPNAFFFHEILKWLCRFRDKLMTH